MVVVVVVVVIVVVVVVVVGGGGVGGVGGVGGAGAGVGVGGVGVGVGARKLRTRGGAGEGGAGEDLNLISTRATMFTDLWAPEFLYRRNFWDCPPPSNPRMRMLFLKKRDSQADITCKVLSD